MIVRIFSVGAVIAILIRPAHALERWYSGNDLLPACRVVSNGTAPTAENAQLVGVCLGQIEALNWAAPGIQGEKLHACVPHEVTLQKMAQVIVEFFDQNPERRTEPFEGSALEALSHSWPCSDQGTESGSDKD